MAEPHELPAKDKASHARVHYVAVSKQESERCSRCQHFIFGSPPRCETVKNIDWAGWCERFKARA